MITKSNTIISETTMKELKKKKGHELEREVIELQRSSEVSILEIGKRLIILKETWLKANGFRTFLKEQAKISYDIANKYMKIVKRYGIDEDNKENTEIVLALGVKKADKLLRISNLEKRIEYIKENDLINKSYKDIEELLNKDYPSETKNISAWVTWSNVQTSIENQINYIDRAKQSIEKYGDIQVKKNNNQMVKMKDEMNTIQIELNKLLNRMSVVNAALEDIKNKELEEKKKDKEKNKKAEGTA